VPANRLLIMSNSSSKAAAQPAQYLDIREYNEARTIASLILRATVLVAVIQIFL
jgi:hypothetical protein